MKDSKIENSEEIVRSQSSVVIKRDAKGVKSYELKVYADTAEEAARIAVEESRNLDIELDLNDDEVKGDK